MFDCSKKRGLQSIELPIAAPLKCVCVCVSCFTNVVGTCICAHTMGTCVPYGDRTQKMKITESEDVLQSEGVVWEKSSSKSAVMGFSRRFKEGDVSVLVGIAYIVDNECKLMEGPLKAWIHNCMCCVPGEGRMA